MIGYFGDGHRFGCNISYVVQDSTNGQGGESTSPGLAHALDSAYHLTQGKTVFFGMADTIMQPNTIFATAFEAASPEDDLSWCCSPRSARKNLAWWFETVRWHAGNRHALTLGLVFSRPDSLLFDHVGLARFHGLAGRLLRQPYMLLIHSVEIWNTRRADYRRTAHRAEVLIANSAFTAGKARLHYPAMPEIANGLDDDCNGVVDDGFDTTVDWPSVKVIEVLWPDSTMRPEEDWVAFDSKPRIVRTNDGLTAIWTDLKRRLRLARLDEMGGLRDAKPLELRDNVAAAFTGRSLQSAQGELAEA